jgi:hypothetical protein
MRTEGRASYSGEPAGINPRAKHGIQLEWTKERPTKERKDAKRLEKKRKSAR